MRLEKEKVQTDFRDVRNTTSSSIPIALSRNWDTILKMKHRTLSGFGVGLSWASTVISNSIPKTDGM